MFLASRIANGIVATIYMLTVGLLVSATFQGLSASFIPVIAVAMIPVALFIFDLVFRKRDSQNGIVFTGCWMAWYLYTAFSSMQTYSNATAEQVGTTTFMLVFVAVILWGLPFSVNAAYLFRQVMQKRSASN